MDILINLILIFAIIILFVLLKYSSNPLLYAGIIILVISGLVLAFNSDLYYSDGSNSTIIRESGTITGVTTQDIKIDLGYYNYIMELFYLSALIAIVVFWTIESPKEEED